MPISAERAQTPSDGASSSDPLIGTQVAGRYRIERIHERGGTSTVYASLHEQQQREVAIKVLDPSAAADPEAVRRFMYEARTASSLSHGHVVGVSDFGQLPDGRPYLVMPMIAGKDLATLVAEEGPLAPTRAATLLRGVASALDSMHERGLVHRDIKSENLMYVRGDDGTETALVLDFGIAARRAELRDERRDDASGTPEFMAPEALDGEHWDHRADVYSLATVAFEMLTGALPFDGDNLSDLVHKKVTHSARTLAEATGVTFTPALEAVIAAGLSTDPTKRPATAGELVRRLAAAASKTDSVAPQAPGRRAARYRTLVGTGSGPRLGLPFVSGRGRAPRRTAPHGLKLRAVPSSEHPAGMQPEGEARFTGAQRIDETESPAPRELTGVRHKLSAARAKLDAARLVATSDYRTLSSERPEVADRPEVVLAEPALPQPAPVDPPDPPMPLETARQSMGVGLPLSPPQVAQVRASVDSFAPSFDLDAELAVVLRPRKRARIGGLAIGAAIAGVMVYLWWPAAESAELGPEAATTTATTSGPQASKTPFEAPPTAADPKREPAPSLEPAAVTSTAQPSSQESPVSPSAPTSATTTSATPTSPSSAIEPAAAPTQAAAGPSSRAHQRAKRTGAAARRARADPANGRVTADDAPPAPPSPQEQRDRAQSLTREATDAMLRGEFGAAQAKLGDAIAADSRYAPAHRSKGLLLERLGRNAEAARALRTYLRLSPNAADAHKIGARLSALEP